MASTGRSFASQIIHERVWNLQALQQAHVYPSFYYMKKMNLKIFVTDLKTPRQSAYLSLDPGIANLFPLNNSNYYIIH